MSGPEGQEPSDVTVRATRVVSAITGALGSFAAMATAAAIVAAWLLSGPWFGFSDTWQLVINTGTTIVTFMMVFVIQNTTNRDGRATQTKLDGIIHALTEANERLVGIEDLPERAIQARQDSVREQARDAIG